MKKLITLLFLSVAIMLAPAGLTSCRTAPADRVTQYQTLRALGTSAKAGMDASTQLLKDGQITVDQWRRIGAFYDGIWQPAFGVAVATAKSDLSSIGSPDLVELAAKFAVLVAQLTQPSTPR